jgi:hypothetical protein
MIDCGRRGREAIIDFEVTRREVVSRVAAGEYGNRGLLALPDIGASGADLQSCRFDQIHDLRKTREGLTIPSQHIVIAQPL